MIQPVDVISVLPIDVEISQALNNWLGTFPHFDRAVHFLNGSVLVKGLPFMTALWWVGAHETEEERDFLLRALVGLLVALVTARWLQNYGPFHARPIANAALGLKSFTDHDANYFVKMNSFPSDHAVEFFGISLAIGSRRFKLGLVAAAWSFIGICLPRVYFGYHYATDIFGGALLGVVVMAVALWIPMPGWAAARVGRLCRKHYAIRQAAMFAVSMELAVNFDNVRVFLHGLEVFHGQGMTSP